VCPLLCCSDSSLLWFRWCSDSSLLWFWWCSDRARSCGLASRRSCGSSNVANVSALVMLAIRRSCGLGGVAIRRSCGSGGVAIVPALVV
jgi:hypothetical protein